MRKLFPLIVLSLLFAISCSNEQNTVSPNIIYILADDLGYGELGVYGQEKIETPNLDALAASGMVFSEHYSGAPVCAPSRCVLLTGKHLGHSYVRGNDEWAERGEVWNFAKAVEDPNLEGQRPIPAETPTIGNVLQENGYVTGMVGKWGLGAPLTDGIPTNRGFDFFYGYNCQRQAHTLYPKHLWKNEEKVWLDNPLVVPGTKLKDGADPYDIESYSDYMLNEYAPALMHTEAMNFIDENKDKPFFLYYASPLPHLPLQAPQKWVDYYLEKFGDEEPYDGKRGYFPCRYPHATYAAMISTLDEQVGDLIAQLKDLGIYENTVIVFSSDNGPTYLGGADTQWFKSGGKYSAAYGFGKGFVRDGGIKVPMIVSWPGKVEANSKTAHISSFYDVLPTVCEIIDVPVPEGTDGMSFLPTVLGKKQKEVLPYYYWEYPEYGKQIAIRMGKWKATAFDLKKKDELQLALYDLDADPLEEHDVAEDYPEIVKDMYEIIKEEHEEAETPRFRIKVLGDSL